MASVLYDLSMIRWLFCLAEVRGSQKWGWGWLKIWSWGLFWLNGRVICSPQSGTKYSGCSEKTRCHKEKRHPTFKSDASFCLSRKVFPDETSPRLHLLEALRVGQNRYIRQMFESNATRHYNPQC